MATESARDDRPRKKKKKKKSGAGLWIVLGVGGGVLLVILIVTVVVIVLRPWERGGDKKNEVAQNPAPKEQPPINKLGGDVVREPKTRLGNFRARGNQIQRDNEMIQIASFFRQYCDIAKNPDSRKLDGFLDFFKRDSNSIYANIKDEKVYTVNVRARVDSEDILAFETEVYTDGYYCVRANNQLGFVPAQEMKAAGLVK
jgi:hypothetical protein